MTVRGAVSRLSSTVIGSPPASPVAARLSELNGIRSFPPIEAIVLRKA